MTQNNDETTKKTLRNLPEKRSETADSMLKKHDNCNGLNDSGKKSGFFFPGKKKQTPVFLPKKQNKMKKASES